MNGLVGRSGPLTPDEAASGLRLGDLAPSDRPYLVLNMVATLDGKASLGGRTAGIGGRADRELFHQLRTQADAVMAGAGTVRTERYGRMVRDPARREKRRREGLAPDPLACVVSGSLAGLDDLPLLAAAEQPVALVTGAEGEIGPTQASVRYVRTPRDRAGGTVDLASALRTLRTEHGIRSVLCEGGPTLNSELLRAGLVDELFLSVAPMLVGGAAALTIVAGAAALPEPAELELVWVLEHEGELYLRLRVRHAGPPDHGS